MVSGARIRLCYGWAALLVVEIDLRGSFVDLKLRAHLLDLCCLLFYRCCEAIGLISFLNRREELSVPSWPAESIRTGMAFAFPVALPRVPAMKVLVWPEPMRVVLDSPATPTLPISILLLPVVRSAPAKGPNAMFLLPMVLLKSARKPLAVLPLPVVF